MYAAMSIDHKPGDAVAALKAALGQPNRPLALAQSSFPGAARLAGTRSIRYTAETAAWTVFCLASVTGQTQLVLEARHGNVKDVCDTVWHAFRHEAAQLKPSLARLELIEPSGTTPVAYARIGVRPLLRRTEIQLALGPGIVTAVILGMVAALNLFPHGHALREIAIGGAPALIVAAVAAVTVFAKVRAAHLVWEG